MRFSYLSVSGTSCAFILSLSASLIPGRRLCCQLLSSSFSLTSTSPTRNLPRSSGLLKVRSSIVPGCRFHSWVFSSIFYTSTKNHVQDLWKTSQFLRCEVSTVLSLHVGETELKMYSQTNVQNARDERRGIVTWNLFLGVNNAKECPPKENGVMERLI